MKEDKIKSGQSNNEIKIKDKINTIQNMSK